jgi:hypothetical protein
MSEARHSTALRELQTELAKPRLLLEWPAGHSGSHSESLRGIQQNGLAADNMSVRIPVLFAMNDCSGPKRVDLSAIDSMQDSGRAQLKARVFSATGDVKSDQRPPQLHFPNGERLYLDTGFNFSSKERNQEEARYLAKGVNDGGGGGGGAPLSSPHGPCSRP